MSECFCKIEANPTAPQVVRLGHWPIVKHRSRVAHGYSFVLPIPSDLFNFAYHASGRQIGPGVELARLSLSASENLDMRATHIHHQDLHRERVLVTSLPCLVQCSHRSSTAMRNAIRKHRVERLLDVRRQLTCRPNDSARRAAPQPARRFSER